MRYEIYRCAELGVSCRNEWHWSVHNDTGELIAQGDGCASARKCRDAIRAVLHAEDVGEGGGPGSGLKPVAFKLNRSS